MITAAIMREKVAKMRRIFAEMETKTRGKIILLSHLEECSTSLHGDPRTSRAGKI